MIIWCVILSVLLLVNIGLSIYTYLQSQLNKKAITEVLAPMWEKHEKLLVKLLRNK